MTVDRPSSAMAALVLLCLGACHSDSRDTPAAQADASTKSTSTPADDIGASQAIPGNSAAEAAPAGTQAAEAIGVEEPASKPAPR